MVEIHKHTFVTLFSISSSFFKRILRTLIKRAMFNGVDYDESLSGGGRDVGDDDDDVGDEDLDIKSNGSGGHDDDERLAGKEREDQSSNGLTKDGSHHTQLTSWKFSLFPTTGSFPPVF